MKKVEKVEVEIIPVMDVFDRQWNFLGHIEDSGTTLSLRNARERWGTKAAHVVPALAAVTVEVGE